MHNKELDIYLRSAIKAAKESGQFLLENLGKIRLDEVNSKRTFDFVTHIDLESEESIIRCIREEYPDHAILAEETGEKAAPGAYTWIIDPLDGTTNYIHENPVFSVSIALKYNDELLLGVVFDPNRNELFHAIKNEGAFLNQNKISVSKIDDMSKALIATGFPFRRKDLIEQYLNSFAEIFKLCAGIRRAGSAALDLCYVGCGRLDGFWEIGLSIWDICAGVLIIKEAGGAVSDFLGGNDFWGSGNIVAGNQIIFENISDITRHAFRS
ncbi:inositol monophosphatase [candidate division KSB1 bacterium]|nr:inositol monophosphatase [candidate division KSB1 bacterium]